MPLVVTSTGMESCTWTLKRNGDVRLNDVLLHALEIQHGVALEAEALLTEVLGDDEGEDFDLEPLFDRLRMAAAQVPGFAISTRYIVSNFHFQKLAIVKDLKEHGDQLAAHDVIAGIAGDREARESARGDRSLGDPRELDVVPPDDEFLVRDADSTQQQAIGLALSGRNGVISGPPGTGKSQTIANLIAECVARGKTVLFVAEKRAALDVVLERLKSISLGHLCLDLHGADISRKLVARQLKDSLDLIRSVPMPDAASLHRQFVDKRDKLNAHVRRMHDRRAPAELSVYALLGKLERLPDAARNDARWAGAELVGLDAPKAEQATNLLRELASGFSGLVTGDDPSPWTGAVLTTATVAQKAMERAGRLAQRWPAVASALQAFESTNTVRPCHQRAGRARDVGCAGRHRCCCGSVRSVCFWPGSRSVGIVSEQGSQCCSVEHGRFCTNRDFRVSRAALLGFAHGRKGLSRDVASGSGRASLGAQQVAGHCAVRTPLLVLFRTPHGCDMRSVRCCDDLTGLMLSFPGRPLSGVTLTTLADWLPRLAGDSVTPFRIVRAAELERELQQIDGGRSLTGDSTLQARS